MQISSTTYSVALQMKPSVSLPGAQDLELATTSNRQLAGSRPAAAGAVAEPGAAVEAGDPAPEAGQSPTEASTKTDSADSDERQKELAELKQIRELQATDRKVRAHEQAHAAVGGNLTGAPTYVFERGPDGVNYAVAGEVSVASPVVPGDPEKTLRQAEQVQRAALAPADPSPQDRRAAADAARIAAQARLELARQGGEESAPEATAEVADESGPDDAEARSAASSYEAFAGPENDTVERFVASA